MGCGGGRVATWPPSIPIPMPAHAAALYSCQPQPLPATATASHQPRRRRRTLQRAAHELRQRGALPGAVPGGTRGAGGSHLEHAAAGGDSHRQVGARRHVTHCGGAKVKGGRREGQGRRSELLLRAAVDVDVGVDGGHAGHGARRKAAGAGPGGGAPTLARLQRPAHARGQQLATVQVAVAVPQAALVAVPLLAGAERHALADRPPRVERAADAVVEHRRLRAAGARPKQAGRQTGRRHRGRGKGCAFKAYRRRGWQAGGSGRPRLPAPTHTHPTISQARTSRQTHL